MKSRLLANVSDKETEGIFALISHTSPVSEIFQILNCHRESLKFNFLFISKFRFDWVHGKMLNDTYLMVIKINYVGDTAIVTRCFNDKYGRQYSFYLKFPCFKVACRVKTNTTWTTKNTISFHYFSKKIKTNTLQGHKKYIKLFELEINNLRIQILAAKMT